MDQSKRPTDKELTNRLKEAEQCLNGQEGLFADPGKAAPELEKLDIGDSAEVWPLIVKLLREIRAKDYTGSRPPQKSYEKSIEGRELFAFSWESGELEKRMYLKFAIKNGRFYYVSLHIDRPPKERST